MLTNNKNTLVRWILSGILVVFASPFSFTTAEAADCSDAFYIDETLPNGARWDMCWESRNREGITFSAVYFTPKNGVRRMVLNHAAVAQIHVPYDDNGTRFHDVSDLGIGGLNMLDLDPDECPGGTMLLLTDAQFTNKKVMCKQIEKRNVGFKSGNNTEAAYSFSLFSVSPVGAYYYIPTWRFMDDGSIEPWMGATGALQRFGTDQSQGWLLGDDRVGVSHLHNFFWKLDFDINNSHLDDVVEEVNFPLVNGKRQRSITAFNSEAARKVNPDTMRHWRIRDKTAKNSNNHSISYDIVLNETGHQDIGPASEPFTHNDFYVTRQNNNEKFASHNTSGGANLAEFVNGESLQNNDLVVWAGVTFYHMPRSEDAPHMDAHWSHMQIIARDLSASNSLGNQTSNSAPTIVTPSKQNSGRNTSPRLTIQANDSDGDYLLYSATGLPNGLNIDTSTGQISGTVTNIGDYQVVVSVSDGEDSSTTSFSWKVTESTDTGSSGGGGSFPIEWLVLLSLFTIIRKRLYSTQS
jgi:hypothetical protein